MYQQNFKNHTRIWPAYHIGTGSGLLIFFIVSIVNLVQAASVIKFTAWLLLLAAIILLAMFFSGACNGINSARQGHTC
jgi:multidrug transporter EmrE-like cation transporter